ncbi:cytochrome B6 [filamentous cyanobacterium LEGE 11480]|uniref:Cytochrome B6 n=1 Tax=Romeriopsis navalis LEGE 11480 TaxID=2777977 RepID=A0A928VRT9_9CYAN|nr:cytochrome b6-f complex subunit PetL [Romeriopsis navalis]MBE9031405.1 cytochrome B6 [Romeriopsis navalis LEGE 11480]
MGTVVAFFLFLAVSFGLAVGLMFGLRAVKLI